LALRIQRPSPDSGFKGKQKRGKSVGWGRKLNINPNGKLELKNARGKNPNKKRREKQSGGGGAVKERPSWKIIKRTKKIVEKKKR